MSPGDDDESTRLIVGSATALPLGSMVAEFRIERVLGEGGFGIVYLVLDTQLERQVALKEYMPSSLAGRQADLRITVKSERHRETFELGRRSFINEARLLAHFDHPAIVKVLRFWEAHGTAYMAMPYYRGRTLEQHLREAAAPPSEAWLRSLLAPLLEGLEQLHREDVLHRDIAPDNILLLPSGLPLLLDFGAARHVIVDATQALTVILKAGYAPVEQYAESRALKQGPWTDIYALAAVMYFAVGRRRPQPSIARLLSDDMPRATELGAGRYSREFLEWIDLALAVRPEDRPRDIATLRKLLPPGPAPEDERTVVRAPLRVEQGFEPRVPPPPPSPPQSPQGAPGAAAAAPSLASPTQAAPRRRIALLAAGGVALAAMALAVWVSRPVDSVRPGAAPAPSVLTAAGEPAAQASVPAAPTAPASAAAPVAAPVAAPAAAPSIADAAEWRERVRSGSDASIDVQVRASATSYVARRDALKLSVRSDTPGYLYVWLATADAKEVELLLPRRGDPGRIQAGVAVELAQPAQRLVAAGPAGEQWVLAMVSRQPRDWMFAGLAAGRSPARLSVTGPALAAEAAGRPACASQPDCDRAYGSAQAQFTVVEPPAEAPVRRASEAGPPRNDKAAVSRECASLIQRLSLGEDSPALREKLNSLHCL